MKAVKIEELTKGDIIIVENEDGSVVAVTVDEIDEDDNCILGKGVLEVYPNGDDQFIVLENRRAK